MDSTRKRKRQQYARWLRRLALSSLASDAVHALTVLEQGHGQQVVDAQSHPPRVVVHREVMRGAPCLAGSRLPALTLLAMVDGGDRWEHIVEGWPWLTPQHVDAARAWLAGSGAGKSCRELMSPPPHLLRGHEVRPARSSLLLHAHGEDSADLAFLPDMSQAADETENATVGEDLFTGAYIVRIAALSPQRVITATVTPLNLGTDESDLAAVVSWEGIDTVSTSVRTEVEPGPAYFDPWLRFLHLLWVVLGPKTVPEAKDFGAGRWSSIVLSTQELDGALQHSVVVVVDRKRGTASLVRSDPTRRGAEVAVPEELLKRDAGAVLTEMTSQLIRGRPWQ